MNKTFLSVAALFGALSVALGAFAAHKLKEMLTPDAVAIFETGVRYQFYHVFALFVVAILSEKYRGKWMRWSGNCFITGIILFSGSLYLLAALRAGGISGYNALGILTPIGGVFLIAGWLLLFWVLSRKS